MGEHIEDKYLKKKKEAYNDKPQQQQKNNEKRGGIDEEMDKNIKEIEQVNMSLKELKSDIAKYKQHLQHNPNVLHSPALKIQEETTQQHTEQQQKRGNMTDYSMNTSYSNGMPIYGYNETRPITPKRGKQQHQEKQLDAIYLKKEEAHQKNDESTTEYITPQHLNYNTRPKIIQESMNNPLYHVPYFGKQQHQPQGSTSPYIRPTSATKPETPQHGNSMRHSRNQSNMSITSPGTQYMFSQNDSQLKIEELERSNLEMEKQYATLAQQYRQLQKDERELASSYRNETDLTEQLHNKLKEANSHIGQLNKTLEASRKNESDLTKALKMAQTNNDSLLVSNADLEARLNTYERQSVNMESTIQEQTTSLRDQSTQLMDLSKKHEKTTNTLRHQHQTIQKQLNDELKERDTEIENLNRLLDQYKLTTMSLTESKEQLQKQVQQDANLQKQLGQALEKANHDVQSAQNQIKKLIKEQASEKKATDDDAAVFRETIDTLKEEVSALKSTIQAHEQASAEYKQSIHHATSLASEKEKHEVLLQTQLSQCRKQLATSQQSNETLQEKLQKTEANLVRLQTTSQYNLEDRDEQLDHLNEKLAKVQARLKELKQASSQLDMVSTERDKLSSELAEAKGKVDTLQPTVQRLTKKTDLLTSVKARLETTLSEKVTAFQQQHGDMTRQLIELQDKYDDLNTKFASTTQSLRQKEAMVETMASNQEALNQQVQSLQSAHADAQLRVSSLESTNERMNAKLSHYRQSFGALSTPPVSPRHHHHHEAPATPDLQSPPGSPQESMLDPVYRQSQADLNKLCVHRDTIAKQIQSYRHRLQSMKLQQRQVSDQIETVQQHYDDVVYLPMASPTDKKKKKKRVSKKEIRSLLSKKMGHRRVSTTSTKRKKKVV